MTIQDLCKLEYYGATVYIAEHPVVDYKVDSESNVVLITGDFEDIITQQELISFCNTEMLIFSETKIKNEDTGDFLFSLGFQDSKIILK